MTTFDERTIAVHLFSLPADMPRADARQIISPLVKDLLAAKGETLGRAVTGRPVVMDWSGHPSKRSDASISYTAQFAVVAIAQQVRCGVDAEVARVVPSLRTLTRHVLADGEKLAEGDEMAFLCLWTRKEALLKLTGEGLHTDPRKVAVPAAALPIAWSSHSRGHLRSLKLHHHGMTLLVSVAAELPSALKIVRHPHYY